MAAILAAFGFLLLIVSGIMAERHAKSCVDPPCRPLLERSVVR